MSVIAAGCSQTPSQPKTVVASLRITLPNGQPVQAKEVRLVPERGAATPKKEVEAVGRPAADGSFELTTFSPGDGAVPGKYVVVLHSGKGIDPKYTDEDTSGLKVTVPSEGGKIEVKLAP
jgi:hypothetical protein